MLTNIHLISTHFCSFCPGWEAVNSFENDASSLAASTVGGKAEMERGEEAVMQRRCQRRQN